MEIDGGTDFESPRGAQKCTDNNKFIEQSNEALGLSRASSRTGFLGFWKPEKA